MSLNHAGPFSSRPAWLRYNFAVAPAFYRESICGPGPNLRVGQPILAAAAFRGGSPGVLEPLKGFTSHAANRILGRHGMPS
jgi:hypothetical protein